MAKNEILPVAIADGANVLPADEYQKLAARNNGFSAGVARSQELNKVWRQSALIAHVVAQFIAETNNSDVLDNGDIEALKTALTSALSKNITNTVPAATRKTAGITKLSSATDSDDETTAATPKAVKAAYDSAKKVSIDEINKKFARKNSGDEFIAGGISIIYGNPTFTFKTTLDNSYTLFELDPDKKVLKIDNRNSDGTLNNSVTFPNKSGTLALTSSTDTFKAGRLNIESATGDTIFNLGGTNGSSGSEISYVRSSKRTQVHDINSKTTVLFPQKSGELALTSDFISNIRRGAKVKSPDTSEWGPNECPSGCVLTQVVHKGNTEWGVNNWYRPLQIFINGQWKTLAGDE